MAFKSKRMPDSSHLLMQRRQSHLLFLVLSHALCGAGTLHHTLVYSTVLFYRAATTCASLLSPRKTVTGIKCPVGYEKFKELMTRNLYCIQILSWVLTFSFRVRSMRNTCRDVYSLHTHRERMSCIRNGFSLSVITFVIIIIIIIIKQLFTNTVIFI